MHAKLPEDAGLGHVVHSHDCSFDINALLLANPYVTLAISTLVFIGPWILIVPLVLLLGLFFIVLIILGFGVAGIVGGSPAAVKVSTTEGTPQPTVAFRP
ncbi:hypothetical protein CPB85DRAFT_1437651 [Mucidula mucida]|nr:hypothetical protein CPB85DRAFT_1437651 [Mucidula mucida]